MCISTGEAAFSGTILYCGRRHDRVHGLVHVLGYQNTAVNLTDGPNAMLLHLPTRQLTPRHFLSAGRAEIDPDLLRFYADHFPDHAVAVCCFDNADARRAKPLLLWYQPLDPERLTVPALDSHTGGAPDLDAAVPVDHWVLFSTDQAPSDWGAPVAYPGDMRHRLRALLPAAVVGRHYGPGQSLPNGDFTISHRDLRTGDLDRIERLRPTRR